jgi:O-antigen/teichoic acid export membrane protein
MSSRKIISNSAISLVGEIIERIPRILLILLAAKALGDANFGKFAFALSFTNLFLILADGGLHYLLVRDIARADVIDRKLVNAALSLKLCYSAVTIVLIYGAVELTGKGAEDILAVRILGWAMIVTSFADFFASVFRARQQMHYDLVSATISSVLVNGIGIALLLLDHGFIVLSYVYLGGALVKLLYCVLVVARRFVPVGLFFESKTIWYLAKEGFSFAILRFFSLMYTYIDTTMLSLMVGDEPTGWYSAAYRLVFAMMFIPISVMKAVFPAMSKYYNESREQFQLLVERVFKVMFLLGFGIATALFCTSEKIILTLFGEEYLPSVTALNILVFSTAVIFIGTIQTHAARASHHQAFTSKVLAASAALNLALNFYLIPKFSLYGAAFATMASEIFTFVLHWYYIRKNLVAIPFVSLAPRIAILCLAMYFFSRLTVGWHLALQLPAIVMVGLLGTALTGYFKMEELRFLKTVLKRQSEN